VRYARAPVHLRWEIYPVPHGMAQLRFMLLEMVFLKGLWEYNRKLWFRSFPFHFGLYLMAAMAVLLATAAATGWPLHGLYFATGVAGTVLALAGACGLLLRRVADPELRPYNAPADLFNLAFFIVTTGTLLAGYAVERPPVFAIARGLVRFESVPAPPLFTAGLLLGALLAAYIPCSHMAHFIAKYFTYHAVRWDEASPVAGGKIARSIAAYLSYRPGWAASHIGPGTWAEIASANPARKADKPS
jgi:nitrate reductase gamma subunit